MCRSLSLVNCFLIEPSDQIYVKNYGFLSFAKYIGKNISEDLSGRCSQEFLDSGKKSGANVLKPASKRTIQKTAEATGDLIVNKIAESNKGENITRIALMQTKKTR